MISNECIYSRQTRQIPAWLTLAQMARMATIPAKQGGKGGNSRRPLMNERMDVHSWKKKKYRREENGMASEEVYMYIHMYVHKRNTSRRPVSSRPSDTTGWWRLIGSPKLQIIFHKRAIKYRSLLQNMTYKDKGSYESSPPCITDSLVLNSDTNTFVFVPRDIEESEFCVCVDIVGGRSQKQ